MAPTSRMMASSLAKMPTTSVRRLISPFTRSIGFVECSFGRCAGGKLMQARASLSASSINSASFLTLGRSWPATCRPWGRDGPASVLGEGGGDEGRDDAAALFAVMRQRVAHEVNATALPRGVQNLGDCRLQPFMGIRDDELDAAQTPPGKFAQKVGPEGLGLRGADRQAQHLAPAVAVDADRDNHRDRDDVAIAARPHIGCGQPDVGTF